MRGLLQGIVADDVPWKIERKKGGEGKRVPTWASEAVDTWRLVSWNRSTAAMLVVTEWMAAGPQQLEEPLSHHPQ